jgi:glycosyltransferase involved in cell wall biosynthesis
MRRKIGCRFVAYLQDIYPDVAVAIGKAREGFVVRRLRKVLFDAWRAADRVIVVSREMKERCIRHGVRPEQIDVITNWADTDAIRPVRDGNLFRDKQALGDRFVVMYSGNMGLPHLLTPVLDAAERLSHREDVVFIFIGGGVQTAGLKREAVRRSLSNVRFLPYQPKEFLAHSLSAADVHIVSVRSGVSSCLMPSKLYAILAAGSGVLAIAPPDSELAEIVRDSRIGEVCNCRDEGNVGEEVAEAIVRLLDRERLRGIASRGPAIAATHFSRTIQVQRFLRLLRELSANDDRRLSPARPHMLQNPIASLRKG